MRFPIRALSLAVATLGAGWAAAAVEPATLPTEAVRIASALRDRIVAGSRAIDWVREIVDRAGPRLAGSAGDRAAVAAALELLRAQGFANVRAEAVTVPVWQRGIEIGEVVSPVSQPLALAALGGSVPTPEGGLEAEVVRFESIAEVSERSDACRGRIVFIDRPMSRTSDGSGYGEAVRPRSEGASLAARLGAVGLLIRSAGTDRNRLPHTGSLKYETDAPRIPAAALSVPDADMLARLVLRGAPVRVRFTLTCHTVRTRNRPM